MAEETKLLKKSVFRRNDMSKRFERTFSQGIIGGFEIWVDNETGVNYLVHAIGDAGCMTPLLDREGKPVISNVASRKSGL